MAEGAAGGVPPLEWPADAMLRLALARSEKAEAERDRALILRDKYFVRSAVHLQRAEKAEARLDAVRAELRRREECAAAEREAGRVCDYCEDLIPDLREALGDDQ